MSNHIMLQIHGVRPIVLATLIFVGALAIAAPMASAQEVPGSTCARDWAAPAASELNCSESQAITYDFGDLPETYGTLLPNGPRHGIQDRNSDGVPDARGGTPAIWLGPTVDFAPNGESDGQPSFNSDGDDTNSNNTVPGTNLSDEDGVEPIGSWTPSQSNGGRIAVQVNASAPDACNGNRCYLAFWIDWNEDGLFNTAPFASGGEYYVAPVTVGTHTVTFATPAAWQALYMRFRLFYESNGAPDSYLPSGSVSNGEVEDHKRSAVPLAITLASFAATCEADTPVIAWETISEIETAGFNLWRSPSPAAPETQLNPSMIPGHPGSTQGHSYTWVDNTAQLGQPLYYWLEDVDINGSAGLKGPIETLCTGPTAVTLDGLEANNSTDSPAWQAPLIVLIVGIALAGLLSRRAKTA